MQQTITPAEASRPDFVGVAQGFDIARPQTAAEVAAIEAGMDRFAVLVFRDQPLDDAAQLAFTRNFGTLETATGDLAQGAQRRLSMEVNDISNLDRDGRVVARDDRRRLFNLGNMLWHSDSSFKATPAKYSLLSARTVPDLGGNTEFADMRAAYAALDDAQRAEVDDLVCEHSLMTSRGILGFGEFSDEEKVRFAPVLQRLVRTHPVTGARSLFLASHAGAIVGWPVPEARAFLRDLNEHATERRFVHAHAWRGDDLVMWDNRTTMHRARRYDSSRVRDLHRTTLVGEATVEGQRAAA